MRALQLCCVLWCWLCKGMCVRMSWTHCFLIVALVHLFGTTCLGSAGALAARWQTARPHTALQYHRRKCSHKNTYINIRIQYWKHSHKRHLTQSQHEKQTHWHARAHTHWPHNAGRLVLLILALDSHWENKPKFTFRACHGCSHFSVSCQYPLPASYHLSVGSFFWALVYKITAEW